jgi:hypothetical protein
MTPWTEAEIKRFNLRVGMFQRRGLPEDQSEQLADRLARRDQEKDDRRMCIECDNLQKTGDCRKATKESLADTYGPTHFPVKTILQRCTAFKWRVPK